MATEEVAVAPTRFYRDALSEAEQSDLPAALEVEGVDQEIAMLRLRLRTALQEYPEDVKLMFKGVELLVRLVATRYRLTKDDANQLFDVTSAGFREELASVVPALGGHHD